MALESTIGNLPVVAWPLQEVSAVQMVLLQLSLNGFYANLKLLKIELLAILSLHSLFVRIDNPKAAAHVADESC